MADDVHVTGLKELNMFLQALPVKMERAILRAALKQGAKVIANQAKTNVPVNKPSDTNLKKYGGYAGALKDSIRIGSRSKKGTAIGYVRAGGQKTKKGADVYYAHWVEYGTKPHANGRRGWHPGATRNKPFLRPAADTERSRAVIAVGNWIKHRLEQRNWDVADIEVAEE